MFSQTLRLKSLFAAIFCGIIVSLATGLFENGPKIGIPENKYYGYPLVWRVTATLQPTEFIFINLAVDAAFWISISLLALITLEKIVFPKFGISVNYKALFLPLVLFIPLGLIMDFVHEFGHAIWGIASGGNLAYMKIAYFEIYPKLTLTSTFILGFVEVEGLKTELASGLMNLGGSLTTNIVAWLLALLLLRVKFEHKTQVALKILGLFGIFDLPFYVIFPQIGLQHWIFLGGRGPEPLIGARKMGIPDPAFYTMVVLTTLGLVFLYFKSLWERVQLCLKLRFHRKEQASKLSTPYITNQNEFASDISTSSVVVRIGLSHKNTQAKTLNS